MDEKPSPDVTGILARIGQGDPEATEALLPLLYRDLRALAGSYFRQQSPEQTLQPTALVHEAFLKLTGGQQIDWESRAHFLGVAARAMRQILANHAESRRAAKRGGDLRRVTLTGLETPAGVESQLDLIDLDDALVKLAELSPDQAKIVEMRFLAGLEEQEVAHILGLSKRTVQRKWRMARAFLQCELGGNAL